MMHSSGSFSFISACLSHGHRLHVGSTESSLFLFVIPALTWCRFNPYVKKIPWRRKCKPLHNSCLENPMDRGAWWATVHGVAKSRTQLSDWACIHAQPSSISVHIMHSENSPWLFNEFQVMRFSPRTCFSCFATPLLGLDFCLVWGFVLWIKGIIGKSKVLPPLNISCASWPKGALQRKNAKIVNRNFKKLRSEFKQAKYFAKSSIHRLFQKAIIDTNQ